MENSNILFIKAKLKKIDLLGIGRGFLNLYLKYCNNKYMGSKINNII